MSEFAEFFPGQYGDPLGDMRVRQAASSDASTVAAVMASRGGSVESHLGAAERLVDRAPVVLLAECSCDGHVRAIGWSGAVRTPLEQNGPLAWVIAGLTVCPGYRRSGVGAHLVGAVTDEVARKDPGALLYSIINVRNRASIALHRKAGFVEVACRKTFAGITFDGGIGVLLSVQTS